MGLFFCKDTVNKDSFVHSFIMINLVLMDSGMCL